MRKNALCLSALPTPPAAAPTDPSQIAALYNKQGGSDPAIQALVASLTETQKQLATITAEMTTLKQQAASATTLREQINTVLSSNAAPDKQKEAYRALLADPSLKLSREQIDEELAQAFPDPNSTPATTSTKNAPVTTPNTPQRPGLDPNLKILLKNAERELRTTVATKVTEQFKPYADALQKRNPKIFTNDRIKKITDGLIERGVHEAFGSIGEARRTSREMFDPDWIGPAIDKGVKSAVDQAQVFYESPETLGPTPSPGEDPYASIRGKEPVKAPSERTDISADNFQNALDEFMGDDLVRIAAEAGPTGDNPIG